MRFSKRELEEINEKLKKLNQIDYRKKYEEEKIKREQLEKIIEMLCKNK